MQIKDVMTAPALTVGTETSIKEVASILVERNISGLPVVDAQGAVVGVVSEADILLKEGGERRSAGFLHVLYRHDPEKSDARTAAEAMTSPARTIEPSRPIAEAARMMTDGGINRLPVVEDGRLVGIVTRADLVRAFVRSDAEIEREIRESVELRSHGIDTNALTVIVSSGEVELGGRVATQDDAALVERIAHAVPGVVSVETSLSWGA